MLTENESQSYLIWLRRVVRDGGLYGGDFLLYRRAPDADHAAFVVIVQVYVRACVVSGSAPLLIVVSGAAG